MSAQAHEVKSSARVNFESSAPRPELPDPQIAVDDEFVAIWSTAEVIGALSSDDYRWSFTSILLALLYSEQDISRWFLGYAQSANVRISDISSKRGFRPEQLPEMRRQFAAGGSFVKKHAFTSSSAKLFQGAVDLCRSAGDPASSPLGARHLMAAYIYRLPSGHLDELTQWGFVPSRWSENFVHFVSARFPAESFWATLHQQQFGTAVASSEPHVTPHGEAFTFQLMSPQGPAEFLLSDAANQVLTFASLHKKKALLVSEMLLFALIETGRSESGDPILNLLSNAVATSAGGWTRYEEIVSTHLDRQANSSASVSQPVRCTANFLAVLREAQRIASLVGSPGPQVLIDVRHVVAALLLTKTVATSIMARLGFEIDSLKTQISASLNQISGLIDNRNEWNSVLFGTVHPDSTSSAFVHLRADFSADNIPAGPSASDRLGFRREVRAFASVIASQDLTPPMSIGIFGDWGSGKSFFMKQLEQRIVSLAGKDEDYCSHIVPIWFNAWHYVDQNLWATLVTEIFDKLFAYIRKDNEGDAEKRIKAIEDELSQQQGLHMEAQADLAKAKADRELAENELKNLRQIRKQKENSLSAQLSDVAALVSKDSAVAAKVKEVERDLGLTVLKSSYEAFEAQVKQMQSLGNRVIAVLTGAFREPGWIRRLGFLLIVLGLPAIVVALIGRYTPLALRLPSQFVAGGIAFLASGTLWIRSVYIAGSTVVAKAETTLIELRKNSGISRRATGGGEYWGN